MIAPNPVILSKIGLDMILLFLSVSSVFWSLFQYKNSFDIGIIYIRYVFQVNGLDAFVEAGYHDFNQYLCNSTIEETQNVCHKVRIFNIRGICFLIISTLANALAIYSILNVFGKFCKCTIKGCLQLDFANIIYPLLYSIAFVLYIIISEIFSINNNDIKVKSGIFMMFGGEVACLASLCIFISNWKMLKVMNVRRDKESLLKFNKERKNALQKSEQERKIASQKSSKEKIIPEKKYDELEISSHHEKSYPQLSDPLAEIKEKIKEKK